MAGAEASQGPNLLWFGFVLAHGAHVARLGVLVSGDGVSLELVNCIYPLCGLDVGRRQGETERITFPHASVFEPR